MSNWTMMVGGVVLLVYWAMVLYGISTGRLWRRGGRPILRHREPTLFYTAAVTMILLGLFSTGAMVWIAIMMG
jgi:hypothetical protein